MALVYNQWNNTSTNENFIHPRRVVGDVRINGKIHETMVSTALYNQNPLYPLPKGVTLQELGKVRRGDIVFTLIDNGGGGNYPLTNTYNNTEDNTTVCAISPLNGQGVFGEQNLMSKIQPIGLAFEENERNTEDRFNIHVGGIHTVLNTGNEVINAGDWVMAYAPQPHESMHGGRGKIADKNNLVTLWFKPYKPEIHRASAPKQILNCLIAMNEQKDELYLPSYKEACKSLIDSTLDIGALFVSQHFEAIRDTTLDKEDFLIQLMKNQGHTEFIDKINSKTEKTASLNRKQDWIKKLMVPYSGNNKEFNDKDLLRNQQQAITKFIDSVAYFYHDVAKNVLWRAVSSARPKENFEVHCAAYMS